MSVHAAAASRALTSTPGSPEDGVRWIVVEGAEGDWAGHNGELACWKDGVGVSASPQEGLSSLRARRGSVDDPESVQSADSAGNFVFASWDGTNRQESACFGGMVDGAVTAGKVPGRVVFATDTSTASRAERLRINSTGDLQMGGANSAINASRHSVLRAYTVASLPSASPAGQLIFVSDGADSKHFAVSDGAGWRWPDGEVVA